MLLATTVFSTYYCFDRTCRRWYDIIAAWKDWTFGDENDLASIRGYWRL